MVVALIALVIACGGTATAASVLIHSSSQIANGVVTGTNIHAKTITGGQIANGTITANELVNGSIGTNKLTGAAIKTLQGGKGGSSGPTTSTSSTAGAGFEWDRQTGPDNVAGSQDVITATNVPPGVYAIFAETNISDINPPGSLLQMLPTSSMQCTITTDSDQAYGSTVVGGAFIAGSADVSMQVTHTFSSTGTIQMQCSDSYGSWDASGSSIIAIRLSSAPKVAVTS
jgi:hypothetical protein